MLNLDNAKNIVLGPLSAVDVNDIESFFNTETHKVEKVESVEMLTDAHSLRLNGKFVNLDHREEYLLKMRSAQESNLQNLNRDGEQLGVDFLYHISELAAAAGVRFDNFENSEQFEAANNLLNMLGTSMKELNESLAASIEVSANKGLLLVVDAHYSTMLRGSNIESVNYDELNDKTTLSFKQGSYAPNPNLVSLTLPGNHFDTVVNAMAA